MALRRATTKSRRSTKAAAMACTLSCGPVRASMAAICANAVGLLVLWLCKWPQAAITSAGPAQ